MKKIIFLVLSATIMLFVSCDTQKAVVPASRVELLQGAGFVSPNLNTIQATGDQFSVKLWVYSHYSFNKIVVTSQMVSPAVEAQVIEKTISSTTPGVSFSTNYTTTISGLNVSNDPGVQRWKFTVTDNEGKEFSTYIDITAEVI